MSKKDGKALSVYSKRRADKVRTEKGFSFSKESSVVLRPKIILSADEAAKQNKNFESTGVWYELNEAATAERNEALEKKKKS